MPELPRGATSSWSARSSGEALDRAEITLADVERVAVTQGPGLVGALLVGVSAAKALAWARRLPLVPVDHLRGHVASLGSASDPVEPPFVCLLASGGHTQLLAVRDERRSPSCSARRSTTPPARRSTRARACSVSAIRAVPRSTGSPRKATPSALRLPGRPRARAELLVQRAQDRAALHGRELGESELERRRADLAASYQRAIVRALVGRTREAAEQTGIDRIAVVGGVAANSELRAQLADAAFAPLAYCTDNAAMIAAAARSADAALGIPTISTSMSMRRVASALSLALAVGGRRGRAWSPSPAARPARSAGRAACALTGRLAGAARSAPASRSSATARSSSSSCRRWPTGCARRVGVATEAQERAWTREAERAQQRVLQRLSAIGVPVQPEQSYVRVFNGFSAALDAGTVAALERDPAGRGRLSRYAPPTRPRFVRSSGAAHLRERRHRRASPSPGSTVAAWSSRCSTPASTSPIRYLQDQLLPGIDVLDPTCRRGCAAKPACTGNFRVARHRARGARRRLRRPVTGSTASPPARRSCRSASRAGNRT